MPHSRPQRVGRGSIRERSDRSEILHELGCIEDVALLFHPPADPPAGLRASSPGPLPTVPRTCHAAARREASRRSGCQLPCGRGATATRACLQQAPCRWCRSCGPRRQSPGSARYHRVESPRESTPRHLLRPTLGAQTPSPTIRQFRRPPPRQRLPGQQAAQEARAVQTCLLPDPAPDGSLQGAETEGGREWWRHPLCRALTESSCPTRSAWFLPNSRMLSKSVPPRRPTDAKCHTPRECHLLV